MIEKRVALRDVVTGIRHHLFLPRPIAASNERLAKIVVPVLFALNRMSFTAEGMSKGHAMRTPFGQQKNQKGSREEAAKANF